jgi:hypothetical protein
MSKLTFHYITAIIGRELCGRGRVFERGESSALAIPISRYVFAGAVEEEPLDHFRRQRYCLASAARVAGITNMKRQSTTAIAGSLWGDLLS